MRQFLIAPSLFFCMTVVVNAQPSSQAELLRHADKRVREVYQHGRFWGNRINPQWESDSETYTLRERDKKTKKDILVRFDAKTGEQLERRQPKRGSLSPDGAQAIEQRDRNLFVRDVASGQLTELTDNDKDNDIFLRRPQWSPDGTKILFIESNETEIKTRSMLVPSDPSYPGVRSQRFARVGGTIAKLRVGVVDADGTHLAWLPIKSPHEGFYLNQVQWAGNSNEVLIEQLSRFRDTREFFLVDLQSGESKRIYTETNDAWAISSQGKNLGLTWINDGKDFIVITEKDGWRHAYRYARNGTNETLLTPGDFDIIDGAIVDEASGFYYFYASPQNATQRYLYRVALDGNDVMQRVSPEDQPGWHRYNFSPDATLAFHTWSALDSPPKIELVEIPSHRSIRVLEDNQEIRLRMKELNSPTEFVQLDLGEVTVDAWMMKPKGFDASKKYPVFVYVYGEPHGQTVLDQWNEGQSHFHRVIAELGYVVVSIDNRGTPAPKGAAWRRSIFGSLGPLSTEEQAAAIKELGKQFEFVDLSRVGIWGWSGGGSNTLNAMFRKPDVYHVGIAVVPKPQPHLYNAWFQEIYMRTPAVNKAGYERAAPINFAEGLKGKLLMITGSGETNTHIQIIEGLVDKLIELGKPFDYMVYPNRNHGLREGKGSEVHVRMLIARYLVENLKPGPR